MRATIPQASLGKVFSVPLDDAQLCGPIQPGLDFYNWLIKEPSLRVPIPDTIVVRGPELHRLYNNNFLVDKSHKVVHGPDSGERVEGDNRTSNRVQHSDQKVFVEKIDIDKQVNKEEFVLACLEKYVGKSVPLCHPPEPLEHRAIAVLKRPLLPSTSRRESTTRSRKSLRLETVQCSGGNKSSSVFCNTLEILTPTALQATLLNATDLKMPSPAVIQQFIRSKGKKPGVFRVEWKMSGSIEGEVRAYLITQVGGAFTAYTPPAVNTYSRAKPSNPRDGGDYRSISFDPSLFDDGFDLNDSMDDQQQGHGSARKVTSESSIDRGAGVRNQDITRELSSHAYPSKLSHTVESTSLSRLTAKTNRDKGNEVGAAQQVKNNAFFEDMKSKIDMTEGDRSAAIIAGSLVNRSIVQRLICASSNSKFTVTGGESTSPTHSHGHEVSGHHGHRRSSGSHQHSADIATVAHAHFEQHRRNLGSNVHGYDLVADVAHGDSHPGQRFSSHRRGSGSHSNGADHSDHHDHPHHNSSHRRGSGSQLHPEGESEGHYDHIHHSTLHRRGSGSYLHVEDHRIGPKVGFVDNLDGNPRHLDTIGKSFTDRSRHLPDDKSDALHHSTDEEHDNLPISLIKVSRDALGLVPEYMRRIVHWMETTVLKSEGLKFRVARIVCDFIRDFEDNFWFLQLRGYNLDPESEVETMRWADFKRAYSSSPKSGLNREKTFNRMALEREAELKKTRLGGHVCPLCAMTFQTLDVIRVKDSSYKKKTFAELANRRVTIEKTTVDIVSNGVVNEYSEELPGKHHRKLRQRSPARGGEDFASKEVAAWGYVLSRQAAIVLAEVFRDAGIPMTKAVRDLLMLAPTASDARSTMQNPVPATISFALQSRYQTVPCCYYCFQVVQERYEYFRTASKLYRLLKIVNKLDEIYSGESDSASKLRSRSSQSPQRSHGLEASDKLTLFTDGRFSPMRSVVDPISAGSPNQRIAGPCPMKSSHIRSTSPSKYQDSFSFVLSKFVELVNYQMNEIKKRLEANLNHDRESKIFSYLREKEASDSIIKAVFLSGLSNSLGNDVLPMEGNGQMLRDRSSVAVASNRTGGIAVPKSLFAQGPGEYEGGFGAKAWNINHLKRNSSHWRIFIMAHMLTDLKFTSSHPMNDGMASISYILGNQVHNLPFRYAVQNMAISSVGTASIPSAIWIRQCRMHYVCGTEQDIRLLFEKKRIQLHCFYCSGHVANAFEGANNVTANELGNCDLALDSLNWGGTGALTGHEKKDFALPLQLDGVGQVTLSISVAIFRDEQLPNELLTIRNFFKEQNSFWPPASYVFPQPLPKVWLAMLTPAQPDAYVSQLKEHNSVTNRRQQNNLGSQIPGNDLNELGNTIDYEGKAAELPLPEVDQGAVNHQQFQYCHESDRLMRSSVKYTDLVKYSSLLDEIDGLHELLLSIKLTFDTILSVARAAARMEALVNVNTNRPAFSAKYSILAVRSVKKDTMHLSTPTETTNVKPKIDKKIKGLSFHRLDESSDDQDSVIGNSSSENDDLTNADYGTEARKKALSINKTRIEEESELSSNGSDHEEGPDVSRKHTLLPSEIVRLSTRAASNDNAQDDDSDASSEFDREDVGEERDTYNTIPRADDEVEFYKVVQTLFHNIRSIARYSQDIMNEKETPANGFDDEVDNSGDSDTGSESESLVGKSSEESSDHESRSSSESKDNAKSETRTKSEFHNKISSKAPGVKRSSLDSGSQSAAADGSLVMPQVSIKDIESSPLKTAQIRLEQGDDIKSYSARKPKVESEGRTVMLLALEKLLQMDYSPRWINWSRFDSMIADAIHWAKVQRERVRFAFDPRPLNALTHGLQLLESLQGRESLQQNTARELSLSARAIHNHSALHQAIPGHKPTALNAQHPDLAYLSITFSNRKFHRLDVNVIIHDWAEKYPNSELDINYTAIETIAFQSVIARKGWSKFAKSVSSIAQPRAKRTGSFLNTVLAAAQLHSQLTGGSLSARVPAPGTPETVKSTIGSSSLDAASPSTNRTTVNYSRTTGAHSARHFNGDFSNQDIPNGDLSERSEGVLQDVESDDSWLQPSSITRKKRRFAIYVAIFNNAARCSEVVDVAQLKAYIQLERDRLSKLLALAHENITKLPVIKSTFETEEANNIVDVSLVRAVICSHLWGASSQLRRLFQRYEAEDEGFISLIGFVKAAESCFLAVTTGKKAVDEVAADLLSVAVVESNIRLGLVSGGIESLDQASTVAESPTKRSIIGSPTNLASPVKGSGRVSNSEFPSPVGKPARLTGRISLAYQSRAVPTSTENVSSVSMLRSRLGSMIRKDSKQGGQLNSGKGKPTAAKSGKSPQQFNLLLSTLNKDSLGTNDFSSTSFVPSVELCCDVHGVEMFYLFDLCCSACENEYRSDSAQPNKDTADT